VNSISGTAHTPLAQIKEPCKIPLFDGSDAAARQLTTYLYEDKEDNQSVGRGLLPRPSSFDAWTPHYVAKHNRRKPPLQALGI